MKILLIDTCGTGSLALADTAHSPVFIDCATLPGRSASERLVPTIRYLAARSGISLHSLAAVTWSTAPAPLPESASASAPPKASARRLKFR